MNNGTSFGLWLKQRRRELDLTQPDLAKRVPCSVQTIEKIESGQRRPSKQIAQLLAEALNVSAAEHSMFLTFARADLRSSELAGLVWAEKPSTWRTVNRRPNNLPAHPNPFIGRKQEITEATALISRQDIRLVTFTGTPGIGKTRLALMVADSLNEQFPDGVFLVSLAHIGDPNLVPGTVARVLGVQESGTQPILDTLKGYLQDKRMLLILDNFEQILEATVYLSDLLASAPRLKILVTSRSLLDVYGEYVFEVPSLSLPDESSRGIPPREYLAEYEAIELFVERASAVQRGFDLTAENASCVVEICRRLDGLPLAIELASARVKSVSPGEMLEKLKNSLELLSVDTHGIPERHRTLRSAIDWSYNLLEPEERRLFHRLSVFVGGCTRDAVYDVCGILGDLPRGTESLLRSLSEKSLVRTESGSEGQERFWLLETLREYGHEQMCASNEEVAITASHAAYCVRLLENAEPYFNGPQQVVWLDHLEDEHDNLQAALSWARNSGNMEIELRLLGVIWYLWQRRGYWIKGREVALESLSRIGRPDQSETLLPYAKALFGTGVLCCIQDDYGKARELLESSAKIFEALGDSRRFAHSLLELGYASQFAGDYDAWRSMLEQSLGIFEELGDRQGKGKTLRAQAWLARHENRYEEAQLLLEQSVQLAREVQDEYLLLGSLFYLASILMLQGSTDQVRTLLEEDLAVGKKLKFKRGITDALSGLGNVALHDYDPQSAREYFAQTLANNRELGDRNGVAASLANLGEAARLAGDNAAARPLFEESLALLQELGNVPGRALVGCNYASNLIRQGDYPTALLHLEKSLSVSAKRGNKRLIAACLAGFAALAHLHNDHPRAASLLGAAHGILNSSGLVVFGPDRLDMEYYLSATRAHLNEAEWQVAWDVGQAMTVDQVIAYVQGASISESTVR